MIAVEKEPFTVAFVDAHSKEEAIAALISELDIDQQAVYQSVMQRERVISTGIGIGIAIPHAKTQAAEEFDVVIGIVRHSGIEWDSIDQLPVKLIILICGPDNQHKEYLQLLSHWTKKIKQEKIRQALFFAKDREEVVKILAEC
jgi:PTS system nitrogen regulatory IIA component